ncbi:hypothetical protein COO60DRAFT_1649696 [Scenedesmus sp. NREL 46B-D3]|nr:hypothetical protein COO60DRAFT_1649696 [Scenedesmus sp. NREL 46B-D3]
MSEAAGGKRPAEEALEEAAAEEAPQGPQQTQQMESRTMKIRLNWVVISSSADGHHQQFHLMATPTDFIITGSADGHLKFWKKQEQGVEFVKHYRSHIGAVDGTRSVKVYDVLGFDMIVMMKLPYTPGAAEWIFKGTQRASWPSATSNSPAIHIYDVASGSEEPIASLSSLHASPVAVMRFNAAANTVISSDAKAQADSSGTSNM